MGAFLFTILEGLLYLLAWLPFKVLYLVSDGLYYLVYYIVGYRKKVVRKNLTNSFPEKSPEEIIKIEKGFYRHFCDYIVETIKLLHISDEEMKRRFVYKNSEIVWDILKDNKDVFLMIGHYGNWEWIPSITRWLPESLYLAQIYRPLKNKAADKFFLKLRARFGSGAIAKNDTLRDIIKVRKEGRQQMIGFIADQTPSLKGQVYWTEFLNQETPVLSGAEKIGKKIDANILFLDVVKVKRGYYEATYKVITLDAKDTAENEITEAYIRLMEQMIRRAPQYWLWTHKRWKHKRPAEQ